MGEGKDTRARGWYEYERESVVKREGEEEKRGKGGEEFLLQSGWAGQTRGCLCLAVVGVVELVLANQISVLISPR